MDNNIVHIYSLPIYQRIDKLINNMCKNSLPDKPSKVLFYDIIYTYGLTIHQLREYLDSCGGMNGKQYLLTIYEDSSGNGGSYLECRNLENICNLLEDADSGATLQNCCKTTDYCSIVKCRSKITDYSGCLL